jgi:hypothetical protein
MLRHLPQPERAPPSGRVSRRAGGLHPPRDGASLVRAGFPQGGRLSPTARAGTVRGGPRRLAKRTAEPGHPAPQAEAGLCLGAAEARRLGGGPRQPARVAVLRGMRRSRAVVGAGGRAPGAERAGRGGWVSRTTGHRCVGGVSGEARAPAASGRGPAGHGGREAGRPGEARCQLPCPTRACRPGRRRSSAGRPGGGARWPKRRSLPPPNNALEPTAPSGRVCPGGRLGVGAAAHRGRWASNK